MVYPSKYGGFFPFPIFLIPIIYILIVLIFGAVSDWLLVILIIVTAIIGYKVYKIPSREREKPRIKKLIDEYKESKLRLSSHIDYFCSFEFPKSLNYRYDLHFDRDLYKKLSIMNRITYSKINRYDELGKKINKKIIELTDKAKEQKLIEKSKTESQMWALKGQHKKLNQVNKDELLQKHGLSNSIEDISTRLENLIVEAKKLDKKLEKKIFKLEKIYFIEDNPPLGEKILY